MLTLNLFVWTALMLGQGTSGQACLIPSCTAKKAAGKRIGTWSPRHVVPKHAIFKKFNDVDWGGYRVFLNKQGKLEVLSLIWGVNDGPYSICSADKSRTLKLSDGRAVIDERVQLGILVW